MIISPPFISPSTNYTSAGDQVEELLSSSINESAPGAGAFPLSFDFNWHGGIHLSAPIHSGEALPALAIADGTIAFVRQPSEENNDHTHPLNYNSGWTDDGCVVICHETEIGEGENSKITFYSIYMHLSSIDLEAKTQGDKIYRKEKIGKAGKIYGTKNLIHFEIISSEIGKITGRESGKLNFSSQNGRTDSNWGDIYFHIPEEIIPHTEKPEIWTNPSNQSPPATRFSNNFFLRINYKNGKCHLTSYSESGEIIGTQVEPGDFEYDLYEKSLERYPHSPSAGYELLRRGRVLGPDILSPQEAAHWRQIQSPSGLVWVNLNSPTVTCFSDADFPHWIGWLLIDDDKDSDSHCQSSQIRELLQVNSDQAFADNDDAISIANSEKYNTLSAEEKDWLCERYFIERKRYQQILLNQDNQKKLRRCIFKFPSEWKRADFDKRYDWLLRVYEGGPMKETDYKRMKAHHQALAFWEDANLHGIESLHWHFHPIEFIKFFKNCGWLSKNELIQIIPKNIIRKPGSHNSPTQGIWESPDISTASTFIENHRLELNRTLQKFLITTPLRQACFFGNSTQETGWFRDMRESRGTNPTLHGGWYGRGLLQLTNPNGSINGGNNNYYKYFKFLGRSPHTPPTQLEINWRNAIASSSRHACHSAGAYWVWSNKSVPTPSNPQRPLVGNANAYADHPSKNERMTIQTNNGIKTWYFNQSFTNCATAVNYPAVTGVPSPNMNGLVDRSTAFINAIMVLTDDPRFEFTSDTEVTTPENYTRREIP